jgi:DNA-binding MarR family transcriptional regulator
LPVPLANAIIILRRISEVKETINIMVNSELEDLSVTLWRMVYQTYSRFENCFDQALREQGLTMERYLVLVTVKYHDAPVRITDVARWLERSTNSISMIVDRMVKAGLLRRVRDRSDRRVVNVFLTGKAKKLLTPANMAAWAVMQEGMSPLSSEDRRTFADLLTMLNHKLLEGLYPGADLEGMLKSDSRQQDYMMKQWRKQPWLATPKARRSSSKSSRKS